VSLLQHLQQRTKCIHHVPDRSIMELFELCRSGTSFCDRMGGWPTRGQHSEWHHKLREGQQATS